MSGKSKWLVEQISALRECVLIGHDVVHDFISCRMSPLRCRATLAWELVSFVDLSHDHKEGTPSLYSSAFSGSL